YIVQRVSGKPFEQYVQDNIYTPLNMQRTTFVQPLPDNLKPLMSDGYKKASEKAQPFEFVEAYPAGSVSTSAQDMCNFTTSLLFESFLDRYFPFAPPAGAKMQNAADDAKQIAGFYKSSRRFDSSFLSITTPLGEPKVAANADGTITIDELKNPDGQPKKFEEIGPFLYREVHGQDHVAFKKDAGGTWQFQMDYPFFIFQKV